MFIIQPFDSSFISRKIFLFFRKKVITEIHSHEFALFFHYKVHVPKGKLSCHSTYNIMHCNNILGHNFLPISQYNLISFKPRVYFYNELQREQTKLTLQNIIVKKYFTLFPLKSITPSSTIMLQKITYSKI